MFRYCLLLLLISVPVLAQMNSKVVAKIGDKEITDSEFRARFELMPHITERQFNEDSSKLDFLYSLVAEKLWALEAENLGFASSEVIKHSIADIEKMYVRDALFKKEVESKISFTEKDAIRGMKKAMTVLELNVFSSADSVIINSIYQSLRNGLEFDSLKNIYKDISSEQPVYITFGDLSDESIEDSLYSLKPGQYTSPIKNNSGWFIFSLNKSIPKKLTAEENQKVNTFVKTRTKERRAMKEVNDYLAKLLSEKVVDIDKEIFKELSDKVVGIISSKTKKDTSDLFALNEFDVRDILVSLPNETVNSPFIKFENDPMSLREYLYSLNLSGFIMTSQSLSAIEKKLASSVQSFTEKELITREGYKQGMNNLPEVKKDIQLWKENYLAQILRNNFTDSARVNDDEVYQRYLKTLKDNSTVTQVNITEVLTDKLEIVELILNEVEAGTDFKQLAVTYTNRKWVRDRGGEFGLFPVTMFGELGKVAGTLNVGDVYGPLNTPEGYSVFKVLEKIESKSNFTKSFDEAKDRIKNDLFVEKLEAKYNDFTKELAKKYKVQMNEPPVTKLKLTNVQMFTYRYMGFGGKITAVPYTKPWYEWYHEMKQEILETP